MSDFVLQQGSPHRDTAGYLYMGLGLGSGYGDIASICAVHRGVTLPVRLEERQKTIERRHAHDNHRLCCEIGDVSHHSASRAGVL